MAHYSTDAGDEQSRQYADSGGSCLPREQCGRGAGTTETIGLTTVFDEGIGPALAVERGSTANRHRVGERHCGIAVRGANSDE